MSTVPALPRGLKRQTIINENRFKILMRDIRNDVARTTQNAKNLDTWVQKLSPIVVQNTFTTGKYASETQSILQNIVKASSYSPLPKGGQMELVKGVISENTMHYVTKMGEDMKTDLRKIAVESYDQKLAPKEMAKVMSSKIDGMSNSRAQVIARTETMRASNLSAYTNARFNRGAQSFTVAGAADRCPLCSETYDNQTFTIDQNDMIPPLHPRCRCFPQFSRQPVDSAMDLVDNTVEAAAMASDILHYNGFKFNEHPTMNHVSNIWDEVVNEIASVME